MKAQMEKLGLKDYLILLTYLAVAYGLLSGCNRTGSLKEMMVSQQAMHYRPWAHTGVGQFTAQVQGASSAETGHEGQSQINAGYMALKHQLAQKQVALAVYEQRLLMAQSEYNRLERRVRWGYERMEKLEGEMGWLKEQASKQRQDLQELEEIALNALRTCGQPDPARLVRMQDPTKDAPAQVYFISGSPRELTECGVLDHERKLMKGKVGLGRKLSREMAADDFVPADLHADRLIPVSGRRPKLATVHPSDSFQWIADAQGQVTYLQVIDPEQFWKNSKYLVIVVA